MDGSDLTDFGTRCREFLLTCNRRVAATAPLQPRGRLTRVAGLVLDPVRAM